MGRGALSSITYFPLPILLLETLVSFSLDSSSAYIYARGAEASESLAHDHCHWGQCFPHNRVCSLREMRNFCSSQGTVNSLAPGRWLT